MAPQHDRAATPHERAAFNIPMTCKPDGKGNCTVHDIKTRRVIDPYNETWTGEYHGMAD